MARRDKISPDGDAKIKQLLLDGYTQALVARITGVDPKSVAVRRAELKRSGAVFPMCGCGRSVSHTGTCAHRVKRQRTQPDTTFQRGTTPRVTQYDSVAWDGHRRRIGRIAIPSSACSPSELVAFVESVVPKSFNPHIRDDLCQNILVAVVAGELKIDAIAGALQQFTRDLYQQFPLLDAPISLDQAVHVSDATSHTVADTVADDRPLADEMLIQDETEDDELLEYVSNLHGMQSGCVSGFKRRAPTPVNGMM